jgi:hypothetical protein
MLYTTVPIRDNPEICGLVIISSFVIAHNPQHTTAANVSFFPLHVAK